MEVMYRARIWQDAKPKSAHASLFLPPLSNAQNFSFDFAHARAAGAVPLDRVRCDIYVQRPGAGLAVVAVDLHVVVATLQVQVQETAGSRSASRAGQFEFGPGTSCPTAHAEHGVVFTPRHVEHDSALGLEPQVQQLIWRAILDL